jgi:protein arginine kinase activator
MICDVCKNHQATVFLTQIVDGKMQKVNLCEACSKEKGVTDPTGFALADLLLGLERRRIWSAVAAFRNVPRAASVRRTSRRPEGSAVRNAMTLSEGLAPLLKGMHKGTEHVGKVPTRVQRTLERETRLKNLHRDLRKAVFGRGL